MRIVFPTSNSTAIFTMQQKTCRDITGPVFASLLLALHPDRSLLVIAFPKGFRRRYRSDAITKEDSRTAIFVKNHGRTYRG